MTGTADTEAEEFARIYKLDVMVIPTNRVLKRIEEPDSVYRTEREKYDAIVTDIIEKQKDGRPVLVGTVSIEKSERLSKLLKLRGIKHVVLNAKYPRAGSRDRRAGGPQGHGDDRHQHGRPRHRHPARRQPRVHGAPADAGRSDRRAAAEGAGEVRRRRRVRLLLPPRELLPRAARRPTSGSSARSRRRPTPSTTRSSRSAACTSSAPSATRRAASTTSCAAAPAARATRARRASISRSKTT